MTQKKYVTQIKKIMLRHGLNYFYKQKNLAVNI